MRIVSPTAVAERQVAGYYVHSEVGYEERLRSHFFLDPVAATIVETIELLEDDGKPVSLETVSSTLVNNPGSPAEPGLIIAEICDPQAKEMPQGVLAQLEHEIQDRYASRLLSRALEVSREMLQNGVGANAVTEELMSRLPLIASFAGTAPWPSMEPLASQSPEAPYPLDHLPPLIRDAVAEVLESSQVPTSLAVVSALTCASLSVQHLADIERDSHLTGPISLFGLIIAESGERKSACDSLFGRFIRESQREAMDALKPKVTAWFAGHEIWKCKIEGLKASIRDARKRNKDDSNLCEQLQQLMAEEPVPPRTPDFLMENETPASLRSKLSYMNPRAWLSRALMTSEGGTIFGGHGMGRDTALDYLSTLNKLWDGGEISTGRKADGDQHIAGARVSVGIAVQEAVLRNFIGNSMARESGNLARFLVAWPETMRGSRPFRAAGEMPALSRFWQMARRFLAVVPIQDSEGRLNPSLLKLSPEAKAAWVDFYNETELRQGKEGDLRNFSDVASKSADQASRLAGIFHFWRGNSVSAPVDRDTVQSACQVARWHLGESARFLSSGGAQEESDASVLERWMRDYCRRHGLARVPRRDVQQLGPKRLREGRNLDSAIAFLEEKKRARLIETGKKVLIDLHPGLLQFRGD